MKISFVNLWVNQRRNNKKKKEKQLNFRKIQNSDKKNKKKLKKIFFKVIYRA